MGGQSSAPLDPVADAAWIGLEHDRGGLRLGIHPAAPVHRAGGMESEHGATRHADARSRHHAQDQRAGGKTGAVDDDALAGITDALEQIEKGTDLAARAPQNADLGLRRRTRQRAQRRRRETDANEKCTHGWSFLLSLPAGTWHFKKCKTCAGVPSCLRMAYPFRLAPRNVGSPIPAASKPPSTARI